MGLLAATAGEHAKRLNEMTKAREAFTAGKASPPAPSPTPSPTPTPAPPQIAWSGAPAKSVETPAKQPALAASAPSSTPAASPSPGAPPATLSDPKAIAEALVGALATQAESGRPVARALASAALAMREPDRPFDLAAFSGLDDDEKALVRKFHDACVAIGRDLASGKSAGQATQALATLTAAIDEPKNVAIQRVELCTKVEGFGRVTALDNRRFLPGKSTQVILYTEVDDFASERDAKTSEWTTNLATKVAIFAKHDGTQVWSRDWQAVLDKSSVKRDDFFICERITLSDFLTVGTYVMKSSVRDEKTGAIAEKSVEFSMVADPALAAR